MVVPAAGKASPAKSLSTPAMMRSRVDLPAPLAPSTPILAPGKNDSQMPRRISLPWGVTLRRSFMVKMNCGAMFSFREAPDSATKLPGDRSVGVLDRFSPGVYRLDLSRHRYV